MESQNSITIICDNQVRSKGGKAAAAKLTPQQRHERAIHANQSKKCIKDLPKSNHPGELFIGDSKIACAVLEDGRRVITESSMFEILGRSKTGRKTKNGGVDNLPTFLSADNLKPLISSHLKGWTGAIQFYSRKFGKAYGYEAEIILEICKLFLDARKLGILLPTQLPTADKAEIILYSLGKIGITALIDEATGYQTQRENNELQELFDKFIAKGLQPWTKKFPSEFFEHIKRMYGLEHLKGNPQFAGHIINKFVYNEISPDVLEELKRINRDEISGKRLGCHHQFLTFDIGHPALDKQIRKVVTLMSASDSKEEFDNLFEKSKR